MTTNNTQKTEERQSLLDALDQVTEKDLADLDQQIAETRRRLEALQVCRKIAEVKIRGKPIRANPGSKPGKKKAPPGSGQDDADRRKIVQLLAEKGAMRPATIGQELKIGFERVGDLVTDHPWFIKTQQGIHITSHARQDVL